MAPAAGSSSAATAVPRRTLAPRSIVIVVLLARASVTSSVSATNPLSSEPVAREAAAREERLRGDAVRGEPLHVAGDPAPERKRLHRTDGDRQVEYRRSLGGPGEQPARGGEETDGARGRERSGPGRRSQVATRRRSGRPAEPHGARPPIHRPSHPRSSGRMVAPVALVPALRAVTKRPPSSMTTRSARLSTAGRWVTIRALRPERARPSASTTVASVSSSRWEVGSSRRGGG